MDFLKMIRFILSIFDEQILPLPLGMPSARGVITETNAKVFEGFTESFLNPLYPFLNYKLSILCHKRNLRIKIPELT